MTIDVRALSEWAGAILALASVLGLIRGWLSAWGAQLVREVAAKIPEVMGTHNSDLRAHPGGMDRCRESSADRLDLHAEVNRLASAQVALQGEIAHIREALTTLPRMAEQLARLAATLEALRERDGR